MSDLLDPCPPFTVVMSYTGVGKFAYGRKNCDLLSACNCDQDFVAGELGDWNGEEGPQTDTRDGGCAD